jgi:hypothetical protein
VAPLLPAPALVAASFSPFAAAFVGVAATDDDAAAVAVPFAVSTLLDAVPAGVAAFEVASAFPDAVAVALVSVAAAPPLPVAALEDEGAAPVAETEADVPTAPLAETVPEAALLVAEAIAELGAKDAAGAAPPAPAAGSPDSVTVNCKSY